jgi:hypothetical protein
MIRRIDVDVRKPRVLHELLDFADIVEREDLTNESGCRWSNIPFQRGRQVVKDAGQWAWYAQEQPPLAAEDSLHLF